MDNMYVKYLKDIGEQIRKRNKHSDNRKEWISFEYQRAIDNLIEQNRIQPSQQKEAMKIIKGR